MVFVTHLPFAVKGELLQAILHQGTIGVDFFFLISGFLITTLLLREYQKCSSISLRKFYIRRTLRICPLLLLVLAIITVQTYWVSGANADYRTFFLYYATYLGNFDRIFHGTQITDQFLGSPVLWSLAVEEQFYLLAPFAVALVVRRGKTLHLFLGAYLCTLLYKLYVIRAFTDFSLAYRTLRFSPFSAFDAISLGCILGYLTHEFPLSTRRLAAKLNLWFVTACFALLWVIAALKHLVSNIYFSTFIAGQFCNLMFVLIILFTCFHPRGCEESDSAMVRLGNWFGKISYGVYLYHVLCIAVVGQITQDVEILVPCSLLLTAAVSWLSFHYFEKPFLKVKRKFSV